jgi:hypothetical protein
MPEADTEVPVHVSPHLSKVEKSRISELTPLSNKLNPGAVQAQAV